MSPLYASGPPLYAPVPPLQIVPMTPPIRDALWASQYNPNREENTMINEILYVSARSRSLARNTLRNRQRALYQSLTNAGANLPQHQPISAYWWITLPGVEDALFQELERRGAFDVPALQAARIPPAEICNRAMWIIFCQYGYCWEAIGQGEASVSGWSLGRYTQGSNVGEYREGIFFVSVDTMHNL